MEKEFIVGKWYKNLGNTQNYIGRFLKLEDNCFWVTEYIIDNQHHIHSGTIGQPGGWLVFKNASLIDISEIAQFLPKNHPDLQLINQTKSLFKI